MQRKKDKLLNKLVKIDYNNRLETILEKKYFDESVKNILLNILYKLEISYKDYKQVKQNVETKEEIIGDFINQVKENCNEIKIVKPNSEQADILHGKSFLVNKNSKIIFCLPIERKLLYAISKISKNEKIINDKYFIINETLSDLINIGNSISTVEPIRDFNGYSWTTIPGEIESIEYNLIYQNLLILVGSDFLSKWIKNQETMLDYMDKFINQMEEKYEKERAEKFIDELNKISVLLEVKYDRSKGRNILSEKKEIDEKLYDMQDNKTFVLKITKEKSKLEKEINKIDKTINNQTKLQKEYDERNERLPLKKKIFSIRVLKQVMEEERKEKIAELNKLNKFLNPRQFSTYKKELEKQANLLEVLEINNLQESIDDKKLEIQKIFLECFQHKLRNTKTKQEVLKLIYEFRYYTMLPFNDNKLVRDINELKDLIEEIEKEFLEKAYKMKIIEKFSKQAEINHELLKCIFSVKCINLEDIYVKLEKNQNNYIVEIYDDDVLEDRFELQNSEILNKRALYIRFKKKVKVFC